MRALSAEGLSAVSVEAQPVAIKVLKQIVAIAKALNGALCIEVFLSW
jgi:hypothetical protein